MKGRESHSCFQLMGRATADGFDSRPAQPCHRAGLCGLHAAGGNYERRKDMEKAKPEIEYFFGKPMKIFCGKCGRNMFTSTTRASVEMYLEHNDRCPWCGCGIEKEEPGHE